MKATKAFQTKDGTLHASLDAARSHASKCYNDAMINLKAALQHDCKLHNQDAYRVTEFIEYHLADVFPELLELKEDQELKEDKPDYEEE